MKKIHALSQPLLVPFNHIGGFSTLGRSRALTWRIPLRVWLAPHTANHLAHMWVTKPPTYVLGIVPLVGGQC